MGSLRNRHTTALLLETAPNCTVPAPCTTQVKTRLFGPGAGRSGGQLPVTGNPFPSLARTVYAYGAGSLPVLHLGSVLGQSNVSPPVEQSCAACPAPSMESGLRSRATCTRLGFIKSTLIFE